MNCRDAELKLKAWMDGELDPAAARGVEGHVAACTSCGERVADYRRLAVLIREAEPVPAPDVETGVIYEKACTARREEEGVIRILQRAAVTAAAVLIVSIGFAVPPLAPTGNGEPELGKAPPEAQPRDVLLVEDDAALVSLLINLEPSATMLGGDY